MGIQPLSSITGINTIKTSQASSQKASDSSANTETLPASKAITSDTVSLSVIAASNNGTSGTVKTMTAGNTMSSSITISDLYYDKRDANKDGIVTYFEEVEYALANPGPALISPALNPSGSVQYNLQGSVATKAKEAQGLIDITV